MNNEDPDKYDTYYVVKTPANFNRDAFLQRLCDITSEEYLKKVSYSFYQRYRPYQIPLADNMYNGITQGPIVLDDGTEHLQHCSYVHHTGCGAHSSCAFEMPSRFVFNVVCLQKLVSINRVSRSDIVYPNINIVLLDKHSVESKYISPIIKKNFSTLDRYFIYATISENILIRKDLYWQFAADEAACSYVQPFVYSWSYINTQRLIYNITT